MIFKTNNLILSIDSNSFEIKKFKEYGSFLIKLIDLKTQNDYILGVWDNLEDQEKCFNDVFDSISKFNNKIKEEKELIIKLEQNKREIN